LAGLAAEADPAAEARRLGCTHIDDAASGDQPTAL
jgi:hypothetical protein